MTSPKTISRKPLSDVEATCVIAAKLAVRTKGTGFVDLTPELEKFVAEIAAREGAVTLFVRHTSASLTIQENADPTVLADLGSVLQKLAPESAPWRHSTEGPDDMPAHVKTMLTATSLQIPVLDGRLALGTWQAVYLIEHRRQPHHREVILQFIGTAGG
jgi:secondary thiamine-phosphate synthase enzyme